MNFNCVCQNSDCSDRAREQCKSQHLIAKAKQPQLLLEKDISPLKNDQAILEEMKATTMSMPEQIHCAKVFREKIANLVEDKVCAVCSCYTSLENSRLMQSIPNVDLLLANNSPSASIPRHGHTVYQGKRRQFFSNTITRGNFGLTTKDIVWKNLVSKMERNGELH